MSIQSTLSSSTNQTGDEGGWLTQLGATQPLQPAPLGISLTLLGLLALAYWVYQRLLPKPLAGIPYNPDSANSILGDLPAIWRQIRSGDPRGFFCGMTKRLDSNIVQFFPGPLGNPVVIISDFATTQDILLRRTKEFDRTPSQIEKLRGVIRNHHIVMMTADPQFRKNRELVKDLMTPNFLNTVNAPEIWRNTVQFVELWKLKAKIAAGRPFEAATDVTHMTFDIIKNVAVGKDGNTMIEVYLEQLRSYAARGEGHVDAHLHPAVRAAHDSPYEFPKPPRDETLEAQHRMNEAITPSIPAPSRLFHAVNNRRPYMREAYASKERLLRRQVDLAVRRHEAGEPIDSALDFMIRREIGAAKKQDRAPIFDSPAMFDELYGYLGAGHDTTATTFEWGLKHLPRYPDIQKKARASLRAIHAEAYAQGRQPTIAEITKTPVPYLEAVIEEILRLSGPVIATARQATVDTVVMGRPIPKGTSVFMALWGPGFTSPSVTMGKPGVGGDATAAATAETYTTQQQEEEKKSYTRRNNWDEMDPESFLPERWLRKDEDGKVVYDSQAGPMLSFSLGIRGCFGRRLAYLTMRVLFTLLIWNFELGEIPEELDSWKAVQVLTRKPVQCFVRLSEAA